MPIVLSYEDVSALGALAHQAGQQGAYAAGTAQRRGQELATLANIEQSRNATAAQLQSIQAQERQANADRQFRASASAQEQDFRQQQLAAQQQQSRERTQAALRQAGIREAGDVQQQLLRGGIQAQQAATGHEYRMQEIAAREGYAARGRGPELSPYGVPSADRAKAEMQQFRHLINIKPSDITGIDSFKQKQAEQLLGLSIDQLNNYVKAEPRSDLAQFAAAVAQSRAAAIRGQSSATGGARPDLDGAMLEPGPGAGYGRNYPSTAGGTSGGGGASGGASGGGGADPYGYSQMSREDLMRAASSVPALR